MEQMEQIRNLDNKIQTLISRLEQTEYMAATVQAKSLLPGVKPPVPKAFNS